MYALVKNNAVAQYPYTVTDLRRAHPNVSFPVKPSDAALLEFGLHRVHPTAPPSTPEHRVVVEDAPVLQNGQWTQTWVVRDRTADETQAQSDSVREHRTRLLAESDWTQLPDAPVDSAAWAVYRQALRNVPNQVGFPWTVDWPVTPQ